MREYKQNRMGKDYTYKYKRDTYGRTKNNGKILP